MSQEIKVILDFVSEGKIKNLPNGVDPQDAATVAQVTIGAGTAIWGSIGGSISAQADLISYITGLPISTFSNNAGYLTSFSETDPIFSASPAAGITGSSITNWNAKENALTFSSGLARASNTVTNTFATGLAGGQIIIGSISTNSGLTYKTTSGAGTTGADHIFQVGNDGGTEAMRILNSGKIGIGTSSPLATIFDIKTGTNVTGLNTAATCLFTGDSVAGTSSLLGNTDKVTLLLGSETTTIAAGLGGALGFGARHATGNGTIVTYAGIFGGKENATSGNSAGYLALGTRPNANVIQERMRISSLGNIGIGNNSPTYALDVVTSSIQSNYLQIAGNGVSPTTGWFRISNATATTNIMAPIFWGRSNVSNFPSIWFLGDAASVGADSGTEAIVRFEARYNGTTVGTRPVFEWKNHSSVLMTMLPTGNLGIGTTLPTALLHLKAGTTAANTAPLKFTSGSLLAAPEPGAIEFLSDTYYATITTGSVRKTLAFLESPSFTTPNLGVATATSFNGNTITTGTGTLTIAAGKTLTLSNTLTFAGTDSSTLNVGTGGTLGSAAFTSASAYEVPLSFSSGVARAVNAVSIDQAFSPTWTGAHVFSPTKTAASNVAYGIVFSPTLNAAANNDVLSAIYINPTIAVGAFTGVVNAPFKMRWGTNTNFTISNIIGDGVVTMHTAAIPTSGNYFFRCDGANLIVNAPNAAGSVLFRVNNSTYTQVFNNGNFLISAGGSDAGFKFDVNGTGRIQTSLLIGNIGALNTSSICDLQSITKGFLPPRMTTTQVNAITSPAEGLLACDLTLHGLKIHNGTVWNNVLHSDVVNSKITASAPYTNDGYIEVTIGGTNYKLMTTA